MGALLSRTNPDRIQGALSFISPDDRDTWYRMAMAIKSELGQDGFELWNLWSQRSDKYKASDALSVWRSISATGHNGSITIATLFHEAKLNGWSPTSAFNPLTVAQQVQHSAKIREKLATERKRVERKRAAAAAKAATVWNAASPLNLDHPYLIRKHLEPVDTLRELDVRAIANIIGYAPQSSGERLTGRLIIVPIKIDGELSTVELIDEHGRKAALAGGRKSGGSWSAQILTGGIQTVLVGEGVATVLSAHQATGFPVVAGLSANNLKSTALAIRKILPGTEIIILADVLKNTGEPDPHAIEAAQCVNGRIALPRFGNDRASDATDFNDLAVLQGLTPARQAIEASEPVLPTVSDGNTRETGYTPENTPIEPVPGTSSDTGNTGNTTGFLVSKSGVFYKPDDDEKPTIRICSRLDITAATRDEHGENWGRLLEFRDRDNRLHQWAMPMHALKSDGAEYRGILLSAGLEIEPSSQARKLLTTYIQTTPVKNHAVCTDRTGWHEDVYVMLDRTFGQSQERVILQTMGEAPKLKQRGTLQGWKEHVAALCAGNSRLILAVSMSLAAPLLEIVGVESGGVNLVGGSSTGKTTTLYVASSVWSDKTRLQRWRATGNGLEAVAQVHNDSLLLLDELAQVDPREAGEIAYMLSNGVGKQRAGRDGLARRSARWRLLFLSSGEIGLAEHMNEAGKRSRAGQEVRLADVPADASAGYGLFETLHGYPSGSELSAALMSAIEQHHGTAAPAFLEQLILIDRTDLRQRLNQVIQDFSNKVLSHDAGGQARRVAARFGLIAAAGELATGLGITGWEDGQAIAGAITCFQAWLQRRGGASAQEDTVAIEQVRHFLELHGEARFEDLNQPNDHTINNKAGYRQTQPDGDELYLFFPEVFKKDVTAGLDYRAVAGSLKRAGLLKINDGADRLTFQKRGLGRFYAVLITKDGGDHA